MKCDVWKDKLDAYVDAELPAETMRVMAEHLSGCPVCTSEIVQIMQQKKVTSVVGRRYAPSAELRSRVLKQMAGKPKRRVWQWATAMAVTALLVVGVGLGVVAPRQRAAASSRLIGGIVDRHVTAMAASSLVDIDSSDWHTVKPWFQGKLPFSFNPPDLSGTDYRLVGGRMVYVDGEPGAHLICDERKHHISVLVFEENKEFERLLSASETPWRSRSFNVQTWSRGGLRFFLVSDTAPQDLGTLAAMWEKANS